MNNLYDWTTFITVNRVTGQPRTSRILEMARSQRSWAQARSRGSTSLERVAFSRMRRGVLALATALVLIDGASAVAAVPSSGVELGGDFGLAVASATGLTSDTMELDLQVEANRDATVVAHLIEPGGTQETVPLASRDDGAFGIRTEVRKTDYLVVFEAIEGSVGTQSQPVRLTDLGVDPALVGLLTLPPENDDEISDSTRQWGWAGLGLAALALTMVALWALPDRRRRARAAETAAAEPSTDQSQSINQ